jgi:hypothetical protein
MGAAVVSTTTTMVAPLYSVTEIAVMHRDGLQRVAIQTYLTVVEVVGRQAASSSSDAAKPMALIGVVLTLRPPV